MEAEHRHSGGGQRVAEPADDDLPEVLLNLVGAKLRIDADQFLQQLGGVDDAGSERAEGAQAHHAELRIPDNDRVLGAHFMSVN